MCLKVPEPLFVRVVRRKVVAANQLAVDAIVNDKCEGNKLATKHVWFARFQHKYTLQLQKRGDLSRGFPTVRKSQQRRSIHRVAHALPLSPIIHCAKPREYFAMNRVLCSCIHTVSQRQSRKRILIKIAWYRREEGSGEIAAACWPVFAAS